MNKLPPFPITKYAENAAAMNIAWPTAGGIRWHVRKDIAKQSGLESAIIRKGKRILIDPERFLEWLQKQ